MLMTAILLTISVPGVGRLPYEHVTDVRAESMEALAAKASPLLRAYSDSTGYEACGAIAKHPDGSYSVIIGTNKSHIACVNMERLRMEGSTPTGITIHSHGGEKSFNANRADRALNKHIRNTVHGQDLHHFSRQDIEGGPGYLATPDGPIYQEGK